MMNDSNTQKGVIKMRNIYYFIAGLFAFLFAITHIWNGHTTMLSSSEFLNLSLDTRTVFTYIWHMITAENIIFGMAFIFMSFQVHKPVYTVISNSIVLILIVRLTIILSVTLLYDSTAFMDTLIDSVAIVFYVALIIVGTLKAKKQTHLKAALK